MYNYDIKMSRDKIKKTNVSLSNKWQVSNTSPLFHILSLSTRANIWKMALKKVKNLSRNKEVYQFQVVCVSYLKLHPKQGIKGEN